MKTRGKIGWAIALAALAFSGCDVNSAQVPEPPARKPAPPHWNYQSIPDTMRGGTGYVACLDSENEAELSLPYKSQRLSLCIVHDAAKDIRVTLRLPDGGQFVCATEGCITNARYGPEPMTKWDGSYPQDGAHDVLIFTGATTITYKLMTPTALQVEPTFYQDGAQIIRFPAVALDRGRMHLPETELNAIVGGLLSGKE